MGNGGNYTALLTSTSVIKFSYLIKKVVANWQFGISWCAEYWLFAAQYSRGNFGLFLILQ